MSAFLDEYDGPMQRWVNATPLPFQFLWHARCGMCGARFWFGGRRARFEQHWQLEHAKSDDPQALVTVREGRGR